MKSVKILFLLSALFLLTLSHAFGESLLANEYPDYQTVIQTGIQTGILTIPCVDTPEQPCMVQDAKFQLTEEGGWRLTDLKVAGMSPFVNLFVNKVELIVTETFPVQVFLKIDGVTDLSIEMGKIAQRLKGNRFEIFMYAEDKTPETNDYLMLLVGFEKIIPLSVYGLSAGTYEYSLNGVVVVASDNVALTGTFVLTRDNKLGAATEIGIGKTTLEVSGTDTFTAHQVSVPGYDGLYWGIFQWNPYTLSWTLKDAGLEK